MFGGNGGSKIISSLAQIIQQTIIFNNTIKESIEMPRFHNQFTPLKTEYEMDVPKVKNFRFREIQ